jgi:hypothetical protein
LQRKRRQDEVTRGRCLSTTGDIWCKGDGEGDGTAEGERCEGRQRGDGDDEQRDRDGKNPTGTVELLVEPVERKMMWQRRRERSAAMNESEMK